MLFLRPAILISALFFQAQPADYALTEQERATWNQYAQKEHQLQQLLGQVANQAAEIEVNPTNSMQVHSAIAKNVDQQKLVKARRDAFLAQLRADHGCRDCMVQDGKLIASVAKK